jgi:UDP-glucose 4-epimerase
LTALLAAENVTGAVNVASGHGVSLRAIGRMLAEISGQPEELLQFCALPDRVGEPLFLVADVARLAEEASFRPAYMLEERLAQCLAWHRTAFRDS